MISACTFALRRLPHRLGAGARSLQTSSQPGAAIRNDTLAQILDAQIEEIRGSGTYKHERILTGPQDASISA